MSDNTKFQHVAVSVSDIDASLHFYRDILGFPHQGRLHYRNERGLVIDFLEIGPGVLLELFSFSVPTKPSTTSSNDLQRGLRHIGFVVEDTDAAYQALLDKGVTFRMEPFDAHGGVRIVFFVDPDGTLLELVQGRLAFDRDGEIPYPERTPGSMPGGLVYDHTAVTVADMDATVAFYQQQLGGKVAGELFFNDERGFHITYMAIGDAVMEFFGFSEPTIAHPWDPDETVLGLKHLGFEVPDVFVRFEDLIFSGVKPIYQPNHALGNVDTAFFEDPDGNALELINGVCTYDE